MRTRTPTKSEEWVKRRSVIVLAVGVCASVGWAQDQGSGLASEVMALLTAEQAEAFAAGADPSSLMLATGETLAEFLERASSPDRRVLAPVQRGGQVTSYGERDDGELQRGVASPEPRFRDNNNGTVRDKLTGLIWLQDADCFGMRAWHAALKSANQLADGQCGLTDGSGVNDWRLPNVRELLSLIDYGESGPALPVGHPFTGVLGDYWSSTTSPFVQSAWKVSIHNGNVNYWGKGFERSVWPVRGGQ